MKIKDVCSRFSSGDFISADKIYSFGNYPVYGGNGLRGYTDNYNFDGECAVIGRQGAYSGNVKFFSGKGHMTEHAIVAIGNENNNTRFLAYKFGLMNLGRYAGQSAQPGLSVETLLNLDIDLPSKDSQDKIATILSYLDNKINLNKKNNATLEAMAKTLYDYWFLQFDFPDENGKPYKSSGGKMIFSPELQREIPEGWKVGKISNFGTLKNGINYDKNTVGDQNFKIVNVKNISESKFSIAIESLDDINLPSKQAENFLTTEKDILIARSGIPGAVRTITGDDKSVIFCGFIICFQPREKVFKNYLMFTLQKNYEILAKKSAGTIMKNITQDTLKILTLPTPSQQILKKFNKAIDPIICKLNKNLLENNLLENLRDFLLPMLMNGQVSFKEED